MVTLGHKTNPKGEKLMKSLLSIVSLMVAFSAANVSAQYGAPVLKAVPQTFNVTISPQNKNVPQIINANIQINQVVTRWENVRTTCSQVDCSDTTGDGSRGNWNGLWSAYSRADKVRALAASVKGIGRSTAEKLIDAGSFRYRPESWRQFSAHIRSSEQTLKAQGYNYNFAENVLGQYGAENAINLGYNTGNACQTRYYDCTIPQEVTREEFYRVVPVTVEVVATNYLLQSFETDRAEISLSIEPFNSNPVVSASFSGHNNYQALQSNEYGRTKITLQGTGRILNRLPSDAVNVVSLTSDSMGLSMLVSVNGNYLPRGDGASRLIMQYEVCRTSWVGTCYEVALPARDVELNSTSQSIRIEGGNIKRGSKYYVRFKAARINSMFYDSKLNSSKETSSVKF